MLDKNNKKIDFQDLMLYRIHEILLVASPYDAFILEEDGKLTEQILSEYLGMNLSYAPRVWNAPTAKKANEMIQKRFFDIIIVMLRISDMNPIKFSKKLKEKFPKKPIVLLAFDQSEIKNISHRNQGGCFTVKFCFNKISSMIVRIYFNDFFHLIINSWN